MKREKRKSSKKEIALKLGIAVAFFAFVAAAAVYAVMLKIEKEMLAGEKQVPVWVFKEEVESNRIVKEDEITSLVEAVSYPESLVPDKAIMEGESLPFGKAQCHLGKGTVLCEEMFCDVGPEVNRYREPVIATVEVADLMAAVGGILRKGDKINLYIFKEEQEIGRYEEVLVENVFDASGMSIPGEEIQPASRINVYLERDEVAEFYRIQQEAVVRSAKLVEP